MDKEEYGIGILKIKKIIGMMPITTVPRTPEHGKGLINLWGKVLSEEEVVALDKVA